MIIADKILALRKNSGYSQEELAEKLNVSRQSVSKWESCTSVPELSKIIEMSKLFGVSTDYLLKEEMEDVEFLKTDDNEAVKKVSTEEANQYIVDSRVHGKEVGIGVALCILSPLALFLLSEKSPWQILSQRTADTFGLIVLFITVTIAVSIFIFSSSKMSKHQHLKETEFSLDYGVSGILRQKRASYCLH